ncbi:hypothetical protein MFIFM68171_04730 [Madurella fahalii]|uniref:Uncharacterized protein n=1 Tax=Madurella fahalii TaxID=1157608 RepID=A0ABQ0GAB2_9PEZI
MERIETATTAGIIDDLRESPPPEQQDPCQDAQVQPPRYEISVPMRGMDEWALWSYLEKLFGDDSNFSVVQIRGQLKISTPLPLSPGMVLRNCRF